MTIVPLPVIGQPAFLTGHPLGRARDGSRVWDFYEHVKFRDAKGVVWFTPDEFESDGASIPGVFHSLLGHPFCSDFIRAAALHDVYYSKWAVLETTEVAKHRLRLAADKMFFEALRCDGVSAVTAWLLYRGVRAGGGVVWRRRYDAAREAARGQATEAVHSLVNDRGSDVPLHVQELRVQPDSAGSGTAVPPVPGESPRRET